jgi:hypothetical protein
MMSYREQLDRLSLVAERTRQNMIAMLDAGGDVTELHEVLDRIRGERTSLAMREHDGDFDAACVDLDESQAVAVAICTDSFSMQDFGEVSH